jgi:hypothetical protein
LINVPEKSAPPTSRFAEFGIDDSGIPSVNRRRFAAISLGFLFEFSFLFVAPLWAPVARLTGTRTRLRQTASPAA